MALRAARPAQVVSFPSGAPVSLPPLPETPLSPGSNLPQLPRLSPAARTLASSPTSPTSQTLINMPADIRFALERYLADALPPLKEKHRFHLTSLHRIQAYLDNRNPDRPARLGMANFNVPLMLEHRTAQVNRVERAIFGHDRPVEFTPTGAKANDTKLLGAFSNLSLFAKHALQSSRMLNGRDVISDVICDMADVGTGAWLIASNPDTVQNMPDPAFTPRRLANGALAPSTPSELLTRAIRRGGVTWEFIPFAHMIYWDGYGTDFNNMPFCGYQTQKTWQQLSTWAAQGLYYQDAVKLVHAHYSQQPHPNPILSPPTSLGFHPDFPPHARPHDVDVVFISWDTNGDGFAEEIECEFHAEAQRLIRARYNQFEGFRPLVAAQNSKPARRRSYRGTSTCQQTIQAQAEANEIHNFTIESAKRGGAWMIVTRADSGIDQELTDENTPFVPGDNYSTEDIENDIDVKELGDPRAGQFLTVLEERLRQSVARLTGFGEPSLSGDVGQAKRVSPTVAGPIFAQAASGSETSIVSLSNALAEAFYLTVVAWRKNLPEAALASVLEQRDVDIIMNLVFRATDIDVRDNVAITIAAKDVSDVESQKRQSLMLIINFIMQYYDRVIALITQSIEAGAALSQTNPQAAAGIQEVLFLFITKIQNTIATLIKTVEELGDPQKILLELDQLQSALSALFQPAPQQPQAGQPGQPLPAQANPQVLPPSSAAQSTPSGIPDLSAAGVA